MQLILSNNQILRGDLVPVLIKRTDLTVVPSTLEFLVRVDEDLSKFIQQGQVISLVEQAVKYRIIFTMKQGDGIMHQGNPNFALVKVIAVLDGCHTIAFARTKAVNEENTTLSAIYRACGATMAFSDDIKIKKFTCLVGSAPSFSIQKALQREASTVVWDGEHTLAFRRVCDLFEQRPKEVLPCDCTQEFVSGFIERHQAPAYFSNNADGSLARAQSEQGRGADYEMFADAQTLNNLSTYLLQRKVWTTNFSPTLNAGDVVEIEKSPFVVITATHLFSQAGSGSGSQMSRFWLGSLSDRVQKH